MQSISPSFSSCCCASIFMLPLNLFLIYFKQGKSSSSAATVVISKLVYPFLLTNKLPSQSISPANHLHKDVV